jgi:F0F1-type ATP synthase assembly protein I
MSHHPKAEKENLNYIYYLVGTLSGLFVGAIINVSCTWILVGAVLGFLTAAAFVNVLAKSSEDA